MGRNIAIVAFILMAISAAWLHGNHHRAIIDKLAYTKALNEAVEAARAQERELQQGANDELKKQTIDLNNIISSRDADIERLRRERPTRPALPKDTRNDESCGTGPALCTDNKILLRTEFARADEIRIGLIRCYADYDKIYNKLNK